MSTTKTQPSLSEITAHFPPDKLQAFQVCTVLLGGLIGALCSINEDQDIVRLAVASWAANDDSWAKLAEQIAEARKAQDAQDGEPALS
jgi:hypothetical protein